MLDVHVLVTSQTKIQPKLRTEAPKAFSRLPVRLMLAAITLGAETCVIAALGHPWLPTHQILTAPITFLAALFFFGRKPLQSWRFDHALARNRAGTLLFLALHAVAFLATVTLQMLMLRAHGLGATTSPLQVVTWLLCILLTASALLAAVLPPNALVLLARQLGIAWAYAIVCAFLAVFARALEYLAWDAPTSFLGNHLASATFSGVKVLLSFFYPHIFADSARRILGTPTFLIHVAGTCSGIEGLGLTLVLTVSWLIFERHHLRLARAFWLVPLALCIMAALNLLRLTALIAIGSAGYPKLALTGFHTEAGWIAFTLVALGFLLAASHLRFFRAAPSPFEDPGAISIRSSSLDTPANPVGVAATSSPVFYLLPLVAILATSLFTRAASTGFEVFYPVRLIVVAIVLFAYRRQLSALTWRFSALDLAAGVFIGLGWVFAARHADGSVFAAGLADLNHPMRLLWLTGRIFAAVVTVPVAEELAFRGYLARRIVSEDFASIRFASLTTISILTSSVVFGAMHGDLWLLGIFSGMAFALLARRGNSLGSAIAAHAAANLVLAIAAVSFGHYGLW